MSLFSPGNKKVNASLRIMNADHTPLFNQEVTLRQTKHKFLFGTAAFDLVPLTNNEYSGKAKETAGLCAEKTIALCNAVTLPFYWGQFEPRQGQPRTEQIRRAAQWCAERNVTLKGHPLCWHTMTADWLLPMSNAEILEAQKAVSAAMCLIFAA